MNECRACGLDFTGIRDFDSHRVGTHTYTYLEGLRLDPPAEDGRRCLDEAELIEKGWKRDRHGRWGHPRRARRSVTVFERLKARG